MHRFKAKIPKIFPSPLVAFSHSSAYVRAAMYPRMEIGQLDKQ